MSSHTNIYDLICQGIREYLRVASCHAHAFNEVRTLTRFFPNSLYVLRSIWTFSEHGQLDTLVLNKA